MLKIDKIGYCLLVLVSLLFLFACGEKSQEEGKKEKIEEEKIKTSEWMKWIADETAICQLSIPGTHDSGAKGKGGIVATQDLSIREQLECGIRCFDIRLRAIGEKLEVYHGVISQGIAFEDEVLPVFEAFLKSKSTEMLIVSLKDEGGNVEDYRRLLWANLSNESLRPFVIKNFREDLTLGECRGKILFLHRHNLEHAQMIGGEFFPGGWRDNASFSCPILGNNNCKADCFVEDKYNFSSISGKKEKVETVIKNIEVAREGKANTWFITFASATSSNIFSGATPLAFAEYVNEVLADEIEKTGKNNCGILFLDFAGKEHGQRLVNAIINRNLFIY